MSALTLAERAAVLHVTSHGAVTHAEAAVHLSREAQDGTDDMADYFAELHKQTLRAGLFDARLANAAERACEGHSFCQGATPCYPHCAEMAVAAPELDASACTTVRHHHRAPRRRNRWARTVRALLCWVLGPHSGL